MMVWYVIKLRTAIGVLKLDAYCVVHYFKQEMGQKRVSTALLAIKNDTASVQKNSFVFRLGRISHYEKKLRSSPLSI